LVVTPPLIEAQATSPTRHALPIAQAGCRLPPQGAQREGIAGSGVKPGTQGLPVAQTGSPPPPQTASQRVMSALSRKPPLQSVGRHAPLTQETAALLATSPVEQVAPQRPQWAAVLSGSQPLAALPSQLSKPVAQVIAQVPATHDGVPPRPEQTIPQAPQWLVLVIGLTQPARAVAQSIVGGAQAGVHTALAQRPLLQVLLHPPQWLLSVSGLMQALLHAT
jgi:hypothetical protein